MFAICWFRTEIPSSNFKCFEEDYSLFHQVVLYVTLHMWRTDESMPRDWIFEKLRLFSHLHQMETPICPSGAES